MVIGLEDDMHMSHEIFAAVPKHPALLELINLIVDRFEAGMLWSRLDAHDPDIVSKHSGRGLFTNAITRYARKVSTECDASAFGSRHMVRARGSNVCYLP